MRRAILDDTPAQNTHEKQRNAILGLVLASRAASWYSTGIDLAGYTMLGSRGAMHIMHWIAWQ